MSHKANTWAWEQDLPALQKIVLLALADRHNSDTGRCDPSIKRVAENCGMSHRSVQSAIRQLTARRLITPTQRKAGEKNLSNLYTLNLNAGEVVQDVHGAGGAPMQDVHQGGAGRAGGVVQDVHQGGAGRAPEPVIEPGSKPGREPAGSVLSLERPQSRTARAGEAEDLNGWTPSMAASSILQRLKMSGGVYLLPALIDVLTAELNAGSDLIAVSTRMCEAWEAYVKAKAKLSYACGAEKFFGQGVWRDQAGWSWKDGPPPQVTTRKYVNEASA